MARILIADDNLMIRTLLRDILSGGGHEVVGESRDGVEAEAGVRRLRPEMVTLDLVMPIRGGLETIPYLRQIDPGLLVLVCSASLDQRRVIAALRLGAVGFIVKPFDRESVLANIADALGPAGRADATPTTAISRPALADATASRADDQRDFARVETALGIRVASPTGDAVATITVDVSAGGVLLATGAFSPGTRVRFALELGSGHGAVHGQARVTRIDRHGRPALAFEQVSVEDHERLNRFLRRQPTVR